MENEKTQSKRKIEGNSEITKGKKAREDKPNHRKKKGKHMNYYVRSTLLHSFCLFPHGFKQF